MDGSLLAKRHKWWNIHNRRRLWGLSFVLPAFLFFVVFAFYPMFNAFYISLTEYSLFESPQFVGLGQYARMLHDPRFRLVLTNTCVFAIGSSIPTWIISLGLALVFVRHFHGRNFLRMLYFLPTVVSGVVVSIVWRIMYHPYGPINATIRPLLNIAPQWLTDRNLVPWAIIITSVWQSIGFCMIIFTAGLEDIPDVFYDAAKVDGANGWQSFWYVTLPLLKPTTSLIMIISLINCFQVFTYQYLLTKGGPSDATNVIGLYVYQNAFQYLRMGYAASMSLVIFIIIMVLTLIQLRIVRSEETTFT